MIFEQFSRIGIIPVVVLDDPKDAAPIAEVLSKNGLPCAEIAFRTPAAEEATRIMSREFPDMLIGAGTILTTDQADIAMNAGAKFIAS
ncbi:MAG: keto-hydroxyglutarate-aldolase/keto-deoxy-phosphogluconate aldolase, partial [Synergistaceae bacterium]|nr:keto-hydroxyglutarate-aldolase/keto-deoxy-phosphogluconate aldolase [Synergistaceae bacterium]